MGLCPKCNADFGGKVPKFCPECGAKIDDDFTQDEVGATVPVAKHMAEPEDGVPAEGEGSEFEDKTPAAKHGARQSNQAPVAERVLVAAPVVEKVPPANSKTPAKSNSKLPFVLAIVGLCLFWIPLLGLGLGVAAIVLWKKSGADKKSPLIIGVIAVVLGLIMTISMFTNGTSSNTQSNDTSAKAEQVADASEDGQQKEKKAESPVESIEATYEGSTDAGTVISSGDKDITVTATCEDGTTKELSSDQWTIDESVTLEAGETSTVTISCEGKSCDLDIECTTLTPDEFKASCESPSYDDLLRYPDDWNGTNIVVTGRVSQVIEGETGQGEYLVQTVDDGYGYYDGPVLIDYVASDDGINIIEDDVVTFYGVGIGTRDYTTVLGANKTVPWMMATYADLN